MPLFRPRISLNLAEKTDTELASFAGSVETGMTGNVNYPTPLNPTLLAFATLISDFAAAVVAWGPVGNRGSHNAHNAVLTARKNLENGINGLAWYCMNTTPYDGDALASAGWEVRLANTPVGLLPVVQDFHQFVSRTVPSGAVKLKWKTPLGVKVGAVSSYKILRSLTADINASEFLGISTKTSYTDLAAGNQPSNFYWVIPVNTNGDGVVSDVVQGYPMGPVLG